MERRSWIFTNISANLLHQPLSQIYFYIIHCISGGWTIQTLCKWLAGFGWGKEISMNIFFKFVCFCSIFASKFHLNVINYSYLSPADVDQYVKRFLLRFAWNWHLLKAIHEAMAVSMFDFAVFDEFFRDPQDILESNSCMDLIKIQNKSILTPTPTFLKIIFK